MEKDFFNGGIRFTDHSSKDMKSLQNLKVCYFGTFREEYPRNKMSIEGLRQAGVQVSICHEPLWKSVEDRINSISGGWLKPKFWHRVLRCYWKVFQKYRSIGDYDVMVVGYPGHYDIYLARLLSWLKNKPLVWDIYNSLYLVMSERGISQHHPLTAKVVRILEKVATRLPDLMLLDSQEFIDWFCKTYHLRNDKFRILPIGADRNELPGALQSVEYKFPSKADTLFWVIYYGTYITNHGIDTIVQAASFLKNDPQISFKMIGMGPERKKAERLVEESQLSSVIFIDWLEKPELSIHLAQAGVCLGSFGNTLQARLTNNNKIYEAFSMKIPVITGKSPALPKSLIHKVHLFLCERNNSRALADAICELKFDEPLRRSIANNSYQILIDQFDSIPLGQLLFNYLVELVNSHSQKI